jgi:hypothetical protein
MRPAKELADWQHIFLDTSYIIDLLSDPARFAKNIEHQQRIMLSHEVQRTLETHSSKARKYYVSSITIGELCYTKKDGALVADLTALFSGDFLQFINYDRGIALKMVGYLHTALPLAQRKQMESHISKSLEKAGCANTRQWMEDDIKIIACAKALPQLDAILTSDKNSFIPFANALEVPVIGMFESEYFGRTLLGELEVIKSK